MFLTDDEIDSIVDAWDLYSPQDNGNPIMVETFGRYDLLCFINECVEKYIGKIEASKQRIRMNAPLAQCESDLFIRDGYLDRNQDGAPAGTTA